MTISELPSNCSRSLILYITVICSSVGLTLAAPSPKQVSGNGHSLEAQRSAIKAKDPQALKDLDAALKKADRALQKAPLSVIDKTQIPPSGDKRDYLSLAPYWWPNPESQDGLPFIRKDGRVNPMTRGEHVDFNRKDQLFARTKDLSRAAYLSGNPKYGIAAVQLLEHWFVNPETRMNPNLDYAQGIPGRNHGRPAGVIEWCGVGSITSSIQLLREDDHFSDETDRALNKWFGEYVDWLQTSKIGMAERDSKNNHGTWYDVQLVGILLFLERDDEARQILEEVKLKRIATQIEPDGRQPHELARTKSLSYSRMNLRAFTRLADMGKRHGVDLWDYETKDGRSIRKASAFLKPYLSGEKEWPYQQL